MPQYFFSRGDFAGLALSKAGAAPVADVPREIMLQNYKRYITPALIALIGVFLVVWALVETESTISKIKYGEISTVSSSGNAEDVRGQMRSATRTRVSNSLESRSQFVNLWALPLGAGLCGVLLFAVGWGLGYRRTKRDAEIAWLKSHGESVTARVIDVQCCALRRAQAAIGRKQPLSYELICEGRDPLRGTLRRFNSDQICEAASQGHVGQQVSVLIHPNDPTIYYVDPNTVAEKH